MLNLINWHIVSNMNTIYKLIEKEYVSPEVEVLCFTEVSPTILASGEGGEEGGEHGGWTPNNP